MSQVAEICAMYEQGASIRQVAKHHQCSICKVQGVLKRNGVKMRPAPTRTPADIEARVVELYSPKMSALDVSVQLGISTAVVYRILKRCNAKVLGMGDRPDLWRARAVLDDKRVWEMRVVALCCRSWTKLGAMFGASPNVARSAALGFTWKHVPMPSELLMAG